MQLKVAPSQIAANPQFNSSHRRDNCKQSLRSSARERIIASGIKYKACKRCNLSVLTDHECARKSGCSPLARKKLPYARGYAVRLGKNGLDRFKAHCSSFANTFKVSTRYVSTLTLTIAVSISHAWLQSRSTEPYLLDNHLLRLRLVSVADLTGDLDVEQLQFGVFRLLSCCFFDGCIVGPVLTMLNRTRPLRPIYVYRRYNLVYETAGVSV